MGDRIKGKVAIVTGAGSAPGEGIGNGKATAMLYAKEGASVMLVDNKIEAAEETKKMIDGEGGECFTYQADVTQSNECKAMADQCIKQYGRIDILQNNVGIVQEPVGGLTDVNEAIWDKLMNTNLKSMFLTCRAILPQMLKQNSGVILNVSSVAAVHYLSMFIYTVSKAGVNALTRCIAVEYADKGIRANAIMPGIIDTPLFWEMFSDSGIEKAKEERCTRIPMKRLGDAWDVAHASLFLVSDEAKYITGQVLGVDGGILAKG